MSNVNRKFILVRHPEGMPVESDWRLIESPVPEPGDGEMLVRTIWLSVDPYMRGRISPAKGYTKGVQPGEVMVGGGVGVVVRSRRPDFREGDIVESMSFGWQDYPVLKAQGTRKVDPKLGPIRHALGILGMPGLTAYFALLDIGKPKAGETVVVSAAAGAVGQVAGQIAKIKGCRAVGVAGSDAKLAWCRELGFDAGVNHHAADLRGALKEACPDGIDIYFDNTAGPIHDAAMSLINLRARVIVVGTIALARQFEQPDIGPRHLRQILVNRARVEGFLVFDYTDRYDEGLRQLAAWMSEGKLRYREDIVEGLENTPKAFLRLLTGENFGKQLVKVSD
ncbi:MAG TPA: zinc-binding dehydrogenase, partial [Alphaproteobacteria bacterium]